MKFDAVQSNSDPDDLLKTLTEHVGRGGTQGGLTPSDQRAALDAIDTLRSFFSGAAPESPLNRNGFTKSSTDQDVELDHLGPILLQALEGTQDAVCSVDVKGRILFANRPWKRLNGAEAVVETGTARNEILSPAVAIRHDVWDGQVIRTGAPLSTIETFAIGNKMERFLTRKSLLKDATGQTIGVSSITTSLAEFDRIDEDDKLGGLVLEQSPAPILVTDTAFRIQKVNPAFERLSRFGSARILGRTLDSLWASEASGRAWRDIRQKVQSGHTAEGDLMLRSAEGREINVWCGITDLERRDGTPQGYLAVLTDLSEFRMAQAENERLARFDKLTGLPNRAHMSERLETLLEYARNGKGSLAVVFGDLDQFKGINDTLGHEVGDALLVEVARRLESVVRPTDLVSRIGGDEFVLLLWGPTRESVERVTERLLKAVAEPIDLVGHADYKPSMSLGYAFYPEHGERASDLLRNADTAMYAAKANRTQWSAFRPEMGQVAAKAFDIRSGLNGALERGEFSLAYQPIFSLSDRNTIGAETLIRWDRPESDRVLPGEFLPTAEATGLALALDRWVLETSIDRLGHWNASGVLPRDWTLSINQGASVLGLEGWSQILQSALASAGLSGPCAPKVQIELTEGSLTGAVETVLGNLSELRRLGVGLAIDDFGKDSSNLARLQTLPVTALKIDAAFVAGLTGDGNARILVEAMLALGRKLNFSVIAEGIESDEQLDLLKVMGCQLGQGYLISHPLAETEFCGQFLKP